ncbi:MAG: YkgJ family cysteine cluster protein [Tepidisphaera sp.]|nr:YkgJ family cysteine cluster protein [Tepidisphaera sp.]
MPDWYELPDDSGQPGLRFSCTLCGNCCTGPEGYVLLSDDDVTALAARVQVSREDFLARYTKDTRRGLSLAEKQSPAGLDCIFLDRDKIPGKAVCGVYEDRPAQCRTWPFWNSNLHSRFAWDRAKRGCPGMDQGQRHSVQQIRICRDTIDM